ncbi:collagenase-like [Culicoides brevitarsis]|uniref:collagenase-like n=1 Tax=Culicoides brevitarsis TaxID=469753 RepID=UPI00307B818B
MKYLPKIVILLVLAAFADAKIVPYIMDGQAMGPKDIPFAAGIMIHRPQNPGWCGGSLVSRNYVLTSAKCVTNIPSASVLLGASDVNRANQTISVSNIIIHPFFDASGEKNDIALLQLSVSANLSDVVGLARLPSKAQKKEKFSGMTATAFGWGKGGKGKASVPVEKLHAVNETVMTNFGCLKKYPAYITDSNVCTESGNGTPCTGDEGGALYVIDEDNYPTQIGIFAYQFSMGCNWGWPAVYTRLTSYLDWIKDNSDVVIREK